MRGLSNRHTRLARHARHPRRRPATPPRIGLATVPLITTALLLILFAAVNAQALPSSEQLREPEPRLLEGTVRLVGSEPFTRVVLTTADRRDYYIEGDNAREHFSAYIGQELQVRAVTGVRELTLAGTERKVREYYIREVEIEE